MTELQRPQIVSLEISRTVCRLGMPRIYVPLALRCGDMVLLDKQASQHLLRVLRLKIGAMLLVFNGRGGEYEAQLEADERGASARVRIGNFIARDAESKLGIQLAQGIARGERMDYAIQKAVELGVTRIIPVFTEFCVVSIKEERVEKRLAHWRGIALSACEQCGRTCVPEIAVPLRLQDWLTTASAGLKLVLDPYATQRLSHLAAPDGDITLLIGPEGGLSDAENRAAKNQGFTPVQLGPRMLRTETAPVAALAAVQALWGDLG